MKNEKMKKIICILSLIVLTACENTQVNKVDRAISSPVKKSMKNNRKPICGCFIVCKNKGNERISSWNEYACDDRGYEYIGYPENVIKDRYSKVFKGTEYTITTSKVSDTYCD